MNKKQKKILKENGQEFLRRCRKIDRNLLCMPAYWLLTNEEFSDYVRAKKEFELVLEKYCDRVRERLEEAGIELD